MKYNVKNLFINPLFYCATLALAGCSKLARSKIHMSTIKENLKQAQKYKNQPFSAVPPQGGDQITYGQEARIQLKDFLKDIKNPEKLVYWDPKSKKYKKSALSSKAFKSHCKEFKKTKQYYVDNLMEIQPAEDGLRGPHKVVASKNIRAYTLLGIYTGKYLAEPKAGKDMQEELKWLQEQSAGGLNKINEYSFRIVLNGTELCLSAFGRGNLLMKINAYATPKDKDDVSKPKPNVDVLQMRYKNNIPLVVYCSKKPIKKGEELLIDYGSKYWAAHWKNNNDLSQPDASIYQNFLKSVPPASDPSYDAFVKFLQEEYPKVYKKIEGLANSK